MIMEKLNRESDSRENTYFRLVTRRSIDLMSAMIDIFYENAKLSLEGDLRYFRFEQFQTLANEPTEVLKRNTILPLQGFVVIPLEKEVVHMIKHHVVNSVGIRSRVYHIRIEKEGELVFAAYDRFDKDSVMVTNIDSKFLDSLITRKAIWSYQLIP